MALAAILNLIALAAIAVSLIRSPAMFLSVIELGLARHAAPMVSDLLTTWGLIKAIGMSSHDKLIVDLEAVAHHAGYR